MLNKHTIIRSSDALSDAYVIQAWIFAKSLRKFLHVIVHKLVNTLSVHQLKFVHYTYSEETFNW